MVDSMTSGASNDVSDSDQADGINYDSLIRVLCLVDDGKIANINLTGDDQVLYLGSGGRYRGVIELSHQFKCKSVIILDDDESLGAARGLVADKKLQNLVDIRRDSPLNVNELPEYTNIVILDTYGKVPECVKNACDSGLRVLSIEIKLSVNSIPMQVFELGNDITVYAYNIESDEDDPVKRLQRWLDPLRNPLFMNVFNVSMTVLIFMLVLLIYFEAGGIHPYILLFLSVCLVILMNWFMGEVRKIVAANKNKKSK